LLLGPHLSVPNGLPRAGSEHHDAELGCLHNSFCPTVSVEFFKNRCDMKLPAGRYFVERAEAARTPKWECDAISFAFFIG
jgi:hypothetical protein